MFARGGCFERGYPAGVIPRAGEENENERYSTVTVRAVFWSYVVVLIVFALAWLR